MTIPPVRATGHVVTAEQWNNEIVDNMTRLAARQTHYAKNTSALNLTSTIAAELVVAPAMTSFIPQISNRALCTLSVNASSAVGNYMELYIQVNGVLSAALGQIYCVPNVTGMCVTYLATGLTLDGANYIKPYYRLLTTPTTVVPAGYANLTVIEV
jgi:hypothetical protein